MYNTTLIAYRVPKAVIRANLQAELNQLDCKIDREKVSEKQIHAKPCLQCTLINCTGVKESALYNLAMWITS